MSSIVYVHAIHVYDTSMSNNFPRRVERGRGGERKCVRERVCKKKSVRVYASEIMSARFKQEKKNRQRVCVLNKRRKRGEKETRREREREGEGEKEGQREIVCV